MDPFVTRFVCFCREKLLNHWILGLCLVKQGFYKNKSEAIIDAVRHFVGFGQARNEIAVFIREELQGRKIKRDYSKKEFDAIWEKVRLGQDWKERFGTDADSVIKNSGEDDDIHRHGYIFDRKAIQER